MLEEEKRLAEAVEQQSVGRETTEERTQLIADISNQEARLEKVDAELARFAEFDPEEIKKLEERVKCAREAANRWVDNIFNCQSWISKKFNIERKDLCNQFGIPAELDYIEP